MKKEFEEESCCAICGLTIEQASNETSFNKLLEFLRTKELNEFNFSLANYSDEEILEEFFNTTKNEN